MKKYIKIALYINILFFSLLTSPSFAIPSKEPIKIGAIYNLTGGQSKLDIDSMRGAKLAVGEINAEGGLIGRRLELIVRDGKTDTNEINKISDDFIYSKDVGTIIGLSDADMLTAALPETTASKFYNAFMDKLFITSGATSPKMYDLVPEHVCLACFVDHDQAKVASKFIWGSLKAKNVYILAQSDMEYANLITLYFQKSYKRLGGKVLATYKFTNDKQSIQKLLSDLKSAPSKPDLIYLAGSPEIVPNIISKIISLNLKTPVFGGDSFDTKELISEIGNKSTPIYFTTHAFISRDNPNPAVSKFIDSYKKAYNEEPVSSFTALGYDTVKLLANALTKAKSSDPYMIYNSILNIRNFDGITGKISFLGHDCIPIKEVTIIKLLNGKRAMAQNIKPKLY